MTNKLTTRKLTYIALLTAISSLSVMFLRVPNGVGGIIHPGDSIIYLTSIFFGPWAGAFVGGVGHSLANLIAGPQVFAPWTFVIKGIMGIVFGIIVRRNPKGAKLWIALLTCTAILVAAYFVANLVIFDFGVAVASILPLSIQGVAGIIVTIALLPIVNKILRRNEL